ncbi:MAG TPA: hypothetical protein DEB40_13455 [Elusimicrobia bacterium]|nr:hypothetical protein [Elusimicrobiota bacterium]HBT62740.1 hypothetical protein [Elusimicrobiota bacterium]
MSLERVLRRGFTLIELMVVVILIGVLAAVAVPKYLRSLENGKADAAVGILNMVATTNRMYAIDHGDTYTSGAITNSCNSSGCGWSSSPCNLIGCNYLAKDDWDAKAWTVRADNPNSPSACGGGGRWVACTSRAGGNAPYASWGYAMDDTGTIYCRPSGTSACSGANDPPPPTR